MDTCKLVFIVVLLFPANVFAASDLSAAATYKKSVKFEITDLITGKLKTIPKVPKIGKKAVEPVLIAIKTILKDYNLKACQLKWEIWATKDSWKKFRMLGVLRPVGNQYKLTLLLLEFGPIRNQDSALPEEKTPIFFFLLKENNPTLHWFESQLKKEFKFTKTNPPVSEEFNPPPGQVSFLNALALIGSSGEVPELWQDPGTEKGKGVADHFLILSRGKKNRVAFPGQLSDHVAERVCKPKPNPGFYKILKNAKRNHTLLTIGEEGIVFRIGKNKGIAQRYRIHQYKRGSYHAQGIETAGQSPPRWAKIAGANVKQPIESSIIASVASESYWRGLGHLVDPEFWVIPKKP